MICVLTCFCDALTGLRSVSVMWRFLGRFGFDDGVWIAKQRIQIAIMMTMPIPESSTRYQYSCNQN